MNVSKVQKLNKINRFFDKEINPEKIDELSFFDRICKSINKFQDIFEENPYFVNLISLSIKEFLFVTNKLLFLIIKMIKNEYNVKIEKISSQNLTNIKTIEEKYHSETKENQNLKNKIAVLEQIIANNTNELNNLKLQMDNNKIDTEQKIVALNKRIEEVNKRAETTNKRIEEANKRIEEANKRTETANKRTEAANKRIEEANKRTFEVENNTKQIIFEMKNSTKKAICKMEKEIKIKISDVEKRMDEKYNKLNNNYNSLLKINLEMIKKEKEIQQKFDNYNKIIKAKNEEKSYLEIQMDYYKNMLDKKDSEFSSMKMCLKNMKLELKRHNIQEFDDLQL